VHELTSLQVTHLAFELHGTHEPLLNTKPGLQEVHLSGCPNSHVKQLLTVLQHESTFESDFNFS
jgi:hypothetical protein